MAFEITPDVTVMENAIEDRLLEFFSLRGIDITDVFVAYRIKQVTFNAAWKYCYNDLFKTDKPQPNNRKSSINYDDIDQLNAIADAYIYLCFVYHIEPTYYGFRTLTGINGETWDRWKNGEVRGKASKPWCDLVQKVREASQNYTRAELENSPVGQITKANNDEEKGLLYSRQQVQAMLSVTPMETAEQIAARFATAELPEKLDL